MSPRPYAAAKRTLSVADKLLEVNWGLVLLIALIAAAGIAMLYSVAGGQFQPWALRQMGHFVLGMLVLVMAAMIDIRVWMSLAYPAYAVALLLLVAVEAVGHMGMGAQRWIAIGPIELQPSELMKITLKSRWKESPDSFGGSFHSNTRTSFSANAFRSSE